MKCLNKFELVTNFICTKTLYLFIKWCWDVHAFYEQLFPGKHKWKHDMCMLCSVCGRCTGYGVDCVNQGQADRNPGTACGCGAGDSGCSECGVCRTCAAEAPDMDGDDIDRQILEKSKELLSIDLMLGTCIWTKKGLETCFTFSSVVYAWVFISVVWNFMFLNSLLKSYSWWLFLVKTGFFLLLCRQKCSCSFRAVL